jgi:hypothetical protein
LRLFLFFPPAAHPFIPWCILLLLAGVGGHQGYLKMGEMGALGALQPLPGPGADRGPPLVGSSPSPPIPGSAAADPRLSHLPVDVFASSPRRPWLAARHPIPSAMNPSSSLSIINILLRPGDVANFLVIFPELVWSLPSSGPRQVEPDGPGASRRQPPAWAIPRTTSACEEANPPWHPDR